jgi:hypothetical protein
MAEQKKKRKSIADDLKELRAMTEASRRRQKGENVTSDQVLKERKAKGIGESSKPSDKRKFVSPQGKEYAGPGYGSTSKAEPKPKPKPKPATTTTASTRRNVTPTSSTKPKPKPERKNVTRKEIVQMYGNVPEIKAGGQRPEPKREQFKSAAAYQKAWREWNRSRGR